MCGLALARPPLARPLLFQASALHAPAAPPPVAQALKAPALGRVAPVELTPVALPPVDRPVEAPEDFPLDLTPADPAPPTTSLWPLVAMEAQELGLLVAANLGVAGAASLASGVGPARLYTELWPLLLGLHGAVSWALILVPLVLTGQTLPMAARGLILAADQPERRITFSLVHLLSVLAFPLSFLCLLLTAEHRTLAELLSGQEILQRAAPRTR